MCQVDNILLRRSNDASFFTSAPTLLSDRNSRLPEVGLLLLTFKLSFVFYYYASTAQTNNVHYQISEYNSNCSALG